MADTLRSNLLRIASDLPEGDPTRRKILAALDRASTRFPSRSMDYNKIKDPDGFWDLPLSEADTHGQVRASETIGQLILFLNMAAMSWNRGHRASTDKVAGNSDHFWRIVDRREYAKLRSMLDRAGDKQSVGLLSESLLTLMRAMELTENQEMALNRLINGMSHGTGWDEATHRNNIFKAANLLGIKLPSAMFASDHTRDAAGFSPTINPKTIEDAIGNADGYLEGMIQQLEGTVQRQFVIMKGLGVDTSALGKPLRTLGDAFNKLEQARQEVKALAKQQGVRLASEDA